MSLDPILWAMKDAPTADINEWGTLCCLAEAADEDGCNSFPSVKTIARYAKISERTVQRALASMQERKLITEGDQRAAYYIPEHLRPTVYDLLIPYAWFRDIERTNRFRRGVGRPPLAAADRPPIAPAPPKKTRADKGKPKPKRAADGTAPAAEAGGRLEVTPVENTASGEGRLVVTPVENPAEGVTGSHPMTGSPAGGDLQSQGGRLEVTQPSPSTHPSYPPHPSVGSTGLPAGEGGTDGKQLPRDEIRLTEGVRFLLTLGDYDAKLMLTGKPLADQGAVVEELFRLGWRDQVLWEVMTRPLPQNLRRSVGAVLAARLRELLDSPAPNVRRAQEDQGTPVPRQYEAGADPVVRRRYECDGRDGLCGAPVEAAGDLCPGCSRALQPAR